MIRPHWGLQTSNWSVVTAVTISGPQLAACALVVVGLWTFSIHSAQAYRAGRFRLGVAHFFWQPQRQNQPWRITFGATVEQEGNVATLSDGRVIHLKPGLQAAPLGSALWIHSTQTNSWQLFNPSVHEAGGGEAGIADPNFMPSTNEAGIADPNF